MRITNAMMSNTTLVNINRNMRNLDKLTQQIESTKKIRVPSDDPIVASRALKFRTSIAETEQFQRNVQNGLAWMNVSESSFTNIITNLLKQFREDCEKAANGTQTSQDKMATVAEMRELLDQIGLEMNQTYAGRYVFSGFRTDQPPVLSDAVNKTYDITQNFSLTDIEKTKSYQKNITYDANGNAITPPVLTNEPIMHNVNILKLAYKNVDTDSSGNPMISIPGYDVVLRHESDIRAYDPNELSKTGPTGQPVIHYIPETGELVMSDDVATNFSASGTPVTYQKTGFQKGELNPLVYFTCTDKTDPANPVTYNMDGQEIQYEFATNTYVTVNSLSKNVFTDKMYADLLRICDFAESLTISDPKLLEEKYSNPPHNLKGDDLTKAVDDQLTSENAKVQSALYDRFNNMLYLVDRHADNAMKEQTQMGSRMHRLELMQSRLEQDEASYTTLMSNNEDTDLEKAIMMRATAEMAYQASLKASASILQLTLANFIG